MTPPAVSQVNAPGLDLGSDASRPGRWRSRIVAAGIFAAALVYVLVVLRPIMLYYADGVFPRVGSESLSFPTFFTGSEFRGPFLDRPGGLAEYAAAFGSQFFAYRLIGATILTLIGWLFVPLTGRLLSATGARPGSAWRYAPLAMLVAIWGRYTFHLTEHLSALLALGAACGYVSLRPSRLVAAAFLPVLAGLYYVAGGPALLLALICGLFELLHRRRWLLGGTYLLAGGLVPLGMGVWAFGLPAREQVR